MICRYMIMHHSYLSQHLCSLDEACLVAVWVNAVLLAAFVTPSIPLLKATIMDPATALRNVFESASARGLRLDNAGGFEETMTAAFDIQGQIVAAMTLMLITTIFGAIVPPLFIIAPAAVWLQLCAADLLQKHSQVIVGYVAASLSELKV